MQHKATYPPVREYPPLLEQWVEVHGQPLTPAEYLQSWSEWLHRFEVSSAPPLRQQTVRLHHVVVLEPTTGSAWLEHWQKACGSEIPLTQLHHAILQRLLPALQELPTGIHRIAIVPGHIYLTLCHMPWAEALQELHCQADAWHIPTYWLEHATPYLVKKLAKLSQWNAQLHLQADANQHLPADWSAWLRQSGWNADGRYAPAWKNPIDDVFDQQSCAVIGAGLSGSAIAQALAQRGWQVTVFEQAAQLGAGASGLPAGLVVPYVSADDNPRARLTRAGVRWMLQHLRHHVLSGQNTWGHTGVQEIDPDHGNSRWHSQAAWVCPQAIVREWLQTPGVTLKLGTQVAQLLRVDGKWHVLDEKGTLLCQAQHVVLANAVGMVPMVQTHRQPLALPADVHERIVGMQAVHGTMSWGHHCGTADHWPQHPVNGNGSFISQAHHHGQAAWMAGSTFETDTQWQRQGSRIAPLEQQHQANWQRLQQLLPQVAKDLAPAFESGSIQAWSGTRCTSQDRLPLVGALYDDLQQGLWLVSAMGARGISLCALAAEWIAAQLHQEPWPLERSLVRSIDVRRLRRKGRSKTTETASKQ